MPEVDPSPVANCVDQPRAPVALRGPAHLGVELLRLARAEAPAESCGLVFGARRGDTLEVERVVALQNRAADAHRRFALDPVEVARAIGEAERAGLAFLGCFHSHPRGDAAMSTTDCTEGWPHSVHLVVGLATGDVRAHWLADGGRCVEVPFAEDLAP